MSGTLYVVGTPIGNLEDITLRAIRTLKEVDGIIAEDTRVTAKLLRHFEIEKSLISFREQNAQRALPQIIARLEAGETLALVTDAGTPSVSDPGEQLVAAAAEHHILVSPIPGASALATAVSAAGLKGDGVRFWGFLPRKGKARREIISSFLSERALMVIYESPPRLLGTLRDLQAQLPDRKATVMRELTKLHEEIVRGTVDELAKAFADRTVKGEIALVLEGAAISAEALDDDQLRDLVQSELDKGGSAKDISQYLSGALGIPRKKVYETALSLLGK